jgi:hypothetical protein
MTASPTSEQSARATLDIQGQQPQRLHSTGYMVVPDHALAPHGNQVLDRRFLGGFSPDYYFCTQFW